MTYGILRCICGEKGQGYNDRGYYGIECEACNMDTELKTTVLEALKTWNEFYKDFEYDEKCEIRIRQNKFFIPKLGDFLEV